MGRVLKALVMNTFADQVHLFMQVDPNPTPESIGSNYGPQVTVWAPGESAFRNSRLIKL